MTINPRILAPADVQAIDAEASTLMKRGIRVLGDGSSDAVAQALICFDRALELRAQLPFQTVPMLRYGLAACWLNRADALMRLADVEQISLALSAYDEALELLRGLPLGDDSRFSRRLAIAHQNRGLALHAHGVPVERTIAAFIEAIATLDAEEAGAIADRRYLLAAVWTNLANARASEGTAESDLLVREAARHAIALVSDLESNDEHAAEVGLKARHVLCQAIAGRLSRAIANGEVTDDVHEATDVVDESLGIVRQWERQGVSRFRGIAHDLFRFGARVYERYQPHFLEEFILENLDPRQSSPEYIESPEIRAAAEEALALAARGPVWT